MLDVSPEIEARAMGSTELRRILSVFVCALRPTHGMETVLFHHTEVVGVGEHG